MTPTHKYPNGRPVTVGELCLADLDDSDIAPGRTLSRPAAGRITKLLDDNRLEITIAPNGYPVIANASRAVSLEDVECLPYFPHPSEAKPLSPQGDPWPDDGSGQPAPSRSRSGTARGGRQGKAGSNR